MVKNYNLIFKWAFRIIILMLTIYYLITYKADVRQIGYISNGIIILISSIIVDVLFKILRIKASNSMDFFIQFFIFLALCLGRMYNFYSIFSWWDLFLHFLSGILLAFIFLALLKLMTGDEVFNKLSPTFILLFIFMFSTSGATLWEYWEFAGDRLLGFDSQLNSLLDTMTDMLMGSLSGLIIALMSYTHIKYNRFKFLKGFINGFTHIKKVLH